MGAERALPVYGGRIGGKIRNMGCFNGLSYCILLTITVYEFLAIIKIYGTFKCKLPYLYGLVWGAKCYLPYLYGLVWGAKCYLPIYMV